MRLSEIMFSKIGINVMIVVLILAIVQMIFPIENYVDSIIPGYVLQLSIFMVFFTLFTCLNQTGISRKVLMVGSVLVILAALMKYMHLKFADMMLIVAMFVVSLSFLIEVIANKRFEALSIFHLIFIVLSIVVFLMSILHMHQGLIQVMTIVAFLSGLAFLVLKRKEVVN